MPAKNTIHTTEITDINNLGYGVCRVDGVVTFVADAVAGDKVKIKIIKSTRDYCVGRIESVIEASDKRIEPDCYVFKSCGGCIYRHISYDYEKQLKKRYVENAFHKVGLDVTVEDVASDNRISGYRNKVQYPVGEGQKIGYYKMKSHEIIECGRCLLESDLTHDLTVAISAYIKDKKIDDIRHIYLRCAEATGEVMVCLVVVKRHFDGLDELIRRIRRFEYVKCIAINLNDRDTNVILGEQTDIVEGMRPYIEDKLLGLTFRISPKSFYQVNHDMAQKLYLKVIELCCLRDGERFIDLYCGCGTIGLCVAASARGAQLTGVEIVSDAVDNARENAKINSIGNAEFVVGDAASVNIGEAELVIVDPPRKGLSPELIGRLVDAKVSRIVYVSCNPDTLARDAALIVASGYEMSHVYPHDLFPRTGHVETVCLMSRKEK